MPELSRFYGIIIKMYFNDTQQHHKPHIHAFYGDYEAVVAVDGDLLAGSIPAKQLQSGYVLRALFRHVQSALARAQFQLGAGVSL